jgi:lantibiotic transport system ATP-binding protein
LRLPRTEIDRVLDIVSLRADGHRRVIEYSLGMRQRLGLARALLGAPKLLVLDEPMNGLDPDGIRDMRHLIRALPARSQTSILLSSHLLSEVEQTATHVGLMHEGRLIVQGGLAEVLSQVPAQLRLRVVDVTLAHRLLAAAGYQVAVEDGVLLVPLPGGDDQAVRISLRLQEAKVGIVEFAHERATLERFYAHREAAFDALHREAA